MRIFKIFIEKYVAGAAQQDRYGHCGLRPAEGHLTYFSTIRTDWTWKYSIKLVIEIISGRNKHFDLFSVLDIRFVSLILG